MTPEEREQIKKRVIKELGKGRFHQTFIENHIADLLINETEEMMKPSFEQIKKELRALERACKAVDDSAHLAEQKRILGIVENNFNSIWEKCDKESVGHSDYWSKMKLRIRKDLKDRIGEGENG